MIISDDAVPGAVVRSASTNSSVSTSASSTSSSSSINLHLVNAPSSLSVNNHNSNNNPSGGLVNSSDGLGGALHSAPSYYFDEKPPSYDDIIKNNVPTSRAKLN